MTEISEQEPVTINSKIGVLKKPMPKDRNEVVLFCVLWFSLCP